MKVSRGRSDWESHSHATNNSIMDPLSLLSDWKCTRDGSFHCSPKELNGCGCHLTKQNGDYISRYGKAGIMPWKDGKENLQKAFQHGPFHGENAFNLSFLDMNLQLETIPIKGKSQVISCSRDKLKSQGHGSGARSVFNKGNRLDGIAVDASNGGFSRVPWESSKAYTSHGAPSCGLKPPTSNGFSRRDPKGAIANPLHKGTWTSYNKGYERSPRSKTFCWQIK
eukprot:Gb_28969 [translate_table: standard]